MLKNKRIIVSIVLSIIFIIIAIFVSTKSNLVIDEKIYNIISLFHSDNATKFFKIVTYLGNAKFIGICCLILLIVPKFRNNVGLPITLSALLTSILNVLLKNIFSRQRPLLEQLVYEESFSFPSGHSMVTAAIYSMLIYLACKNIKNIKIKYAVSIISCCIIFLVGISRIYLRVHYFSDVLAGWILGIAVTLIYSIIFEKIKIKRINDDV